MVNQVNLAHELEKRLFGFDITRDRHCKAKYGPVSPMVNQVILAHELENGLFGFDVTRDRHCTAKYRPVTLRDHEYVNCRREISEILLKPA